MFNVTLNTNDLKYLNVSYIASDEDISDLSTENVEFDEIYKNEKLRINRVDYASKMNRSCIIYKKNYLSLLNIEVVFLKGPVIFQLIEDLSSLFIFFCLFKLLLSFLFFF